MANLNQLAFPSAPKRNGEYVIYAYRDGKFSSCYVFGAPFAAKKFVELVFDGDLPARKGNELEKGNIIVSCELMKRVVDHKYTKEEKEWELPTPYPSHAHTIKEGPRTHEPLENENQSDAAASPRKQRNSTPRAKTPETHVTIQQIADEIKLDPREARQILRKHSEKTEFGWAWPKEGVAKIKSLLTKHRKKK